MNHIQIVEKWRNELFDKGVLCDVPEDDLLDLCRKVADAATAKAKADVSHVKIPETLDTKSFREAWQDWIEYRRERKPKVTAQAAKAQLKKLTELGNDRAIAAIENSIASGYQGIFERTGNYRPGTPQIGRIDAAPDKYAGVGITVNVDAPAQYALGREQDPDAW